MHTSRSALRAAVLASGYVLAVGFGGLVLTVLLWLPLFPGGQGIDIGAAKSTLASFAEVMVAIWLAIGAGFAYIDRADLQRGKQALYLESGGGLAVIEGAGLPIPSVPGSGIGADWEKLHPRIVQLAGRLRQRRCIDDLAELGALSIRLKDAAFKGTGAPIFSVAGELERAQPEARALFETVEEGLAQSLLPTFERLRRRARFGMVLAVGLGISQLLTIFCDPLGQGFAELLLGTVSAAQVPAGVVRGYFLVSIGVACGAGAYLWGELRSLFGAERGLVVLSEMIKTESKPC